MSATALGLMGMGTMSIGGYLGGHLTFVRGVGVNQHVFMEDPAPEWKAAMHEPRPGGDGGTQRWSISTTCRRCCIELVQNIQIIILLFVKQLL